MDLLTPRVADPGPPPLIDNVFTYTVIALTCDWANGKLLYGQIENLIRNEFGECGIRMSYSAKQPAAVRT